MDDLRFEQLRIILVQQHTLMHRELRTDDNIFQLLAAKHQISYKVIKIKFDNMKRQFKRYIREERQLTKWMLFYYENEANSNILHIPFKSEDVDMQENKQLNTSTEIQMDIDAEIETKSSNETKPSEVENDEKFHKFIEFLEREVKK
ncbi:hypothetical protein PVAND_012654 [Polypedilum vanderplanki]|uniref:Uncharacterized protein n=1 Tax=Polypedilum vanderplanki TaxID=319348 RepID=A0A9J6CMA3_POLVA|nr:hypothetical protein PVAND_012654 [Polypedilum vanderplanki]